MYVNSPGGSVTAGKKIVSISFPLFVQLKALPFYSLTCF
jgi:hypothetical protein